MPKQIEVGSTVTVRLYDGRVVVAKVTAVVDSVLGRKIHISLVRSRLKWMKHKSFEWFRRAMPKSIRPCVTVLPSFFVE